MLAMLLMCNAAQGSQVHVLAERPTGFVRLETYSLPSGELTSRSRLLQIDDVSDAYDLTFFPDNTVLAVQKFWGDVELYDLGTGALLHKFSNSPTATSERSNIKWEGSRAVWLSTDNHWPTADIDWEAHAIFKARDEWTHTVRPANPGEESALAVFRTEATIAASSAAKLGWTNGSYRPKYPVHWSNFREWTASTSRGSFGEAGETFAMIASEGYGDGVAYSLLMHGSGDSDHAVALDRRLRGINKVQIFGEWAVVSSGKSSKIDWRPDRPTVYIPARNEFLSIYSTKTGKLVLSIPGSAAIITER